MYINRYKMCDDYILCDSCSYLHNENKLDNCVYCKDSQCTTNCLHTVGKECRESDCLKTKKCACKKELKKLRLDFKDLKKDIHVCKKCWTTNVETKVA